jgi:hypothetical protein
MPHLVPPLSKAPVAATTLELYCSPQGEAFRVYLRPGSALPPYLRSCFDERGEAYPVFLDLEDLERVVKGAREELEIEKSRAGGVALCARGNAVAALGVWLSNAFASGVRVPSAP